MGKLLEVIRRLSIALTWLFGGAAGIFFVGEGWNKSDDTEVAFGAGVLIATYIVHKVINWILLKDEKNVPSENQ